MYCLIELKTVSFLIVSDVSPLPNVSVSLKSLAEKIITKERTKLIGKGNLIFCCTGSRENYFGSVSQQNNNPKFQGRHVEK